MSIVFVQCAGWTEFPKPKSLKKAKINMSFIRVVFAIIMILNVGLIDPGLKYGTALASPIPQKTTKTLILKRGKDRQGIIIGRLIAGTKTYYTLEDTDYAIPTGLYTLHIAYSNKFQCKVLVLEHVPNRTAIEIHPGNFKEDSRGCILIGFSHTDDEVVASRGALRQLLKQLDGHPDVRLSIS